MATRIEAESDNMVTLTGSPLFTDPDGQPVTLEYYRSGRAVWLRVGNEPDKQVCDYLSMRGPTLMTDPAEPLVQLIRREHKRAMAAARRDQKRSGW